MPTVTSLPPLSTKTVSTIEELLPSEEKAHIQHVIDTKTKPLGALGKMEALMSKVASCAWIRDPSRAPAIQHPVLMVFAGDHGIAREGVSIAPSEVTGLMMTTCLSGGASVSVCARHANVEQLVIDCGTLNIPEPCEGLASRRLGQTTAAIHQQPAMSLEQARQGIENGRRLVHDQCEKGMDVLCIGELGIGNTSAAAALMSGLTGIDPAQCVGVGTGIDSAALSRKRELVSEAIKRCHRLGELTPLEWGAQVGGFELVTMAGAIIGAAEHHVPVLVDGFVSSVSALLACKLVPAVHDYLVFSHKGSEQGHGKLLEILNADPLMTLDLRIGEGTGAVMALSLLRSSMACYNEMASFTEAGIDL